MFFWERHSVVLKRGSLIPGRQHQQNESLVRLRGKPIASGGYMASPTILFRDDRDDGDERR